MSHWLELADEVARRHRQGQVLGVDPALVLRGLPPVWRPGLDAGGPGDDVVALAGAALARLDPDAVDDRLRSALVEAAAGCVGADLPGLLRRLRPFLPATPSPDARDIEADAAPCDEAETSQLGAAGRFAAGSNRGGARLAVAGAVLALGLVAIGVAGTGTSDLAATGTPLTPRPTGVGGFGATISWDPPHLVVDVDAVRYRYRFDGEVDTVSLRGGAGGPLVTVTAGDQRWDVAVPALQALSGTAGPR